MILVQVYLLDIYGLNLIILRYYQSPMHKPGLERR
jgi:hypothetical protein